MNKLAIPAALAAALLTITGCAQAQHKATEAAQFLGWLHGRGYREYLKVQHDITAMEQAASNGQPAVAEQAGNHLAADARAAALHPAPVGRQYKQAMLAFHAAGKAASLGQWAEAAQGMPLAWRNENVAAVEIQAALAKYWTKNGPPLPTLPPQP